MATKIGILALSIDLDIREYSYRAGLVDANRGMTAGELDRGKTGHLHTAVGLLRCDRVGAIRIVNILEASIR